MALQVLLKNVHGRLLLIRADAGPVIGYGHVMRSMAIAEEWLARGGRCVWATSQPRALDAAGSGRDDIKVIKLEEEPGSVGDARVTRRLAEETDADWVLTDLHVFTPAYFTSAGARRAKWMLAHDEPLQVTERINAILSPGPQGTPANYPGLAAGGGRLLGLDYALVRSELRAQGPRRNPHHEAPRVLVTFGGSDPDDLTWRSLSALSKELPNPRMRCRAILGPGYRGACAERGADFPNLAVEFVRYTANMGAHYAWADMIVCGASTTLWEAFYFGLPAVALPAAPSHHAVINALADCVAVKCYSNPGAEFAHGLSEAFQSDPVWLDSASAEARKLVDGEGVTRVVDYLVAQFI